MSQQYPRQLFPDYSKLVFSSPRSFEYLNLFWWVLTSYLIRGCADELQTIQRNSVAHSSSTHLPVLILRGNVRICFLIWVIGCYCAKVRSSNGETANNLKQLFLAERLNTQISHNIAQSFIWPLLKDMLANVMGVKTLFILW